MTLERPHATPRAAPAIALNGVSKRYGDELALAPTDLEIAEGEFFCLLGPSGGGKTTLLNLIGGFVQTDSGSIEVRGEHVERTPPHRRCVNTVFQRYALFPHMTIRENVEFGLKMAKTAKREAAARVDEALELVGLEALGGRFPAALSGGQQQRVAVARALVNRPAVLLLDEPLGALDLKLRRRLQVDLKRIHAEVRSTFVYVTHDQEEAMALADRIAVLNQGRVEQVGAVEEIYSRPRTRFVADFIGESNFFPVLDVASGNGTIALRNGTTVVRPSGSAAGCDTLMVRPECVRLSPPGAREQAIAARVLQTSFLGSHVRVLVESSACDVPVQAYLYPRDQGQALTLDADAQVELWWEPQDAVLLASEPAHRDDGR
jgi:spermidine/putrescine transport system ATP-binding protein